MCGIAGALDLRAQRPFPEARLRAMTDAIAHRGPDDEHVHLEPGLALGARRLSIVDLSGGRQPLCNEDRTVWVAFNGELFEYPALYREILDRGHRPATRCDTELWVHLYEDFGEGMFAKAKGQFAVSLWDRKTRTLILGRDRPGIAPLYYAERDGWLLWGSEVKALLRSGLVDAVPDPKGVDHLFTFFCAGTTRTFFDGVKSIPPGHYLLARDGRVELKKYWDLDFPDAGDEIRRDDPTPLVDELEGLLRQSVERRLRGDVPVVSYISGGLDSTVVLGLSSRHRGEAVPSFTIGLDRAGPDERTQSTEAAHALGSQLTTVIMDRAMIAEAYPELVVAAEGPVFDTSCACLMRLASAVHREGYKVALTGEGADEAFAGYAWFKFQQMRDRNFRRFGRGPMNFGRELMFRVLGGKDARRPPAVEGMNGTRPIQQDMFEAISQASRLVFSREMWDRLGDHHPFDDLDLTNPDMKRWAPLNQSLYVGYKVMLAGLLMIPKGDRITMHSSVEGRYPFLDEDVIEFASRVAPEYKLRGRTEKWLLRKVAERTLPPKIANRPKTMFRASFAPTFLGPHRPAWVDQLLSPESLRATGYFDPVAVARERSLQVRLPRITPRRLIMQIGLTSVVSTQLWHHLYCGGGLCELPTWDSPGFAGNRTPGHYKIRTQGDAPLPIAV
ncbi:asparagine synthase (glutamine-hydrolyzing) [Tautonia plasticadhaerens]|uniref:asparagine synthase (glutamine-hydrolyzing) n=1 Tax=Tautonia plasticadhaerens TaxID=2527974 RepID=A0A518GX73_9BACT|nr:asparagine synthase (glutamine-hydrolyzing) [Tautonia plasticadhaerens]QDV33185.1 Asparagine synthetase [glutamine-hydrolyzing] 1 [Tautonia plasticadhaerens]